MVGLPTSESRELILRTLLSKEKVNQLDFKELATMTEGYSGSDLKVSSNPCPDPPFSRKLNLIQW
jgi:SpoVK/Ycf46/Vps4 family AAA+-type ATPase